MLASLFSERRALAPAASTTRPRLNSHLHLPPNFSAFETVEQAVGLAREQGLGLVGVSNYYDYSVYTPFAACAAAQGIFPLFGLEVIALLTDLQAAGVKINDPGNPGKMYLCGKGIAAFEQPSAEGAALLATIRENDSLRMAQMIDQIEQCCAAAGLATGLDEAAVKQGIVARHACTLESVYLQERHVAQAFQEALFARVPLAERAAALERLFDAPSKAAPNDAVGIQNELRSQLMKAGKPGYVAETFVGFEHAYRLVLALGGIPCYPTLIDGASPLCPFEATPEHLIAQLQARQIHAAEFIPLRNDPDVLTRYVTALRAAGIVVTAGTEHNTRELLPLEPTCVQSQPIPDALQEIFWEGACVAAAHQVAHYLGEPGYITPTGALNPDYPSAEARIAAFREKGAAVIASFARYNSSDVD